MNNGRYLPPASWVGKYFPPLQLIIVKYYSNIYKKYYIAKKERNVHALCQAVLDTQNEKRSLKAPS